MEFEIKNASTLSSDGIHSLEGVLYIPKGEIKGLFHIIHGMTEHIARYDSLMRTLAGYGYVAFGYDNLGHGKTARDDSELGYIAEKNGYEHLVDDTRLFEQQVSALFPEKPLIVMGHSMGSFIARLAASKYGKDYKKLIICGTAGRNPLSSLGLLIINIIKKFKGDRYISPLVDKIAFGSYNKRFENTSKYNWLSNIPEEIEKYEEDKFCTFKFTVSAMHDLLMLISLCNTKTWFYGVRRDLPILLISGEDDPVGNYGKGVREVYERLKANRVREVILKLYPNARHEIHNDNCREEVTEDILKFVGEL